MAPLQWWRKAGTDHSAGRCWSLAEHVCRIYWCRNRRKGKRALHIRRTPRSSQRSGIFPRCLRPSQPGPRRRCPVQSTRRRTSNSGTQCAGVFKWARSRRCPPTPPRSRRPARSASRADAQCRAQRGWPRSLLLLRHTSLRLLPRCQELFRMLPARLRWRNAVPATLRSVTSPSASLVTTRRLGLLPSANPAKRNQTFSRFSTRFAIQKSAGGS